MNLNLNELLESLEQSSGIEKSASATEEVTPAISAELSAVLEKKAEQDMTKVAFAEGEKLAKELLEKLANELQTAEAVMVAQDDKKIVPNGQGTITEQLQETVEQAVARGAESDDLVDPVLDKKAEQTKQAQENQEMANTIMQKIAQIVGEATTTPAAGENITPGTVPNMAQVANAEMTAFDDAKVQPLPGAEGTVNNILEAIVAGAKAQGAGSDDLVNGEGPAEGSAAIGTQADEQEKSAAVHALVEEGCDFDTAVALVKQAEAELTGEAFEQEKQAAFSALMESGVSFDDAVNLVKAAEEDLAKEAGVASAVGKEFGNLKASLTGLKGAATMKGASKAGRVGMAKDSLKELGKNRLVQGAGAVAAAGAAGAAGAALRGREKKAAFEALVEAGIDFDDAIALVKAAEQDVYGE